MDARIYKPSKTAMQSGHGNTHAWVLEFESKSNRGPEPLMGWTTGDTLGQVCLEFPSLAEAKDYALRKGLSVTVQPAMGRKLKPRNYADNFRYRPEDEA
ncbi:MAG: ETC complex I subunit [Alphaproteobacteria bacterium]